MVPVGGNQLSRKEYNLLYFRVKMYIRTASANGGQSRIIMIDLAKIEYVGKG